MPTLTLPSLTFEASLAMVQAADERLAVAEQALADALWSGRNVRGARLAVARLDDLAGLADQAHRDTFGW